MPMPEDQRGPWERPVDVPPDQEWFWTPEWLAGEREASAQIEAGQSKTFYSGEEFLAYLGRFDEATGEPIEQSDQ